MGGYHLSVDDRNEIWRLHSEGRNANEIATAVCRAYSSVATILRTTGGIRPEVPRRSPLRLSEAEREEISRGVRGRETFTVIARRIGRSTSTVSREVAANGGRRRYRACAADRRALQRAARPKETKLAGSAPLRTEVEAKLRTHWSPQQISAWLRRTFPDDPSMWVSHETIYTSLFVQAKGGLGPRMCKFLRTGRDRRRPRRRGRGDRRGKNLNMVLIHERPAEANDRQVAGHWEGDLIMGRGHRRAIGTLVERTSRFLILVNLVEGYTADGLCDELVGLLPGLPAGLARSLTWDQGTEMSSHATFTTATGFKVFFCEPRSPWQRGTNENTNGLLRQYFPKGVDFAGLTQDRLDHVARELNARPRRTLEWLTPAQRMAQLVR